MGNRPLLRALQEFSVDTRRQIRFRQVILAAPDVDADVFRSLARAIRTTADRVTLYASSKDEALAMSKTIHGYPRAGESGPGLVTAEGIDTIDASAVDTDFLGHSYPTGSRSVLSDIYYLIRDGRQPGERFGMRAAVNRAPGLWSFDP
jgi:esterase/lipase superfamily enzyme